MPTRTTSWQAFAGEFADPAALKIWYFQQRRGSREQDVAARARTISERGSLDLIRRNRDGIATMEVEEESDLFEAGLIRTAKTAEFFQGDIIALSKLLPESDEELIAVLQAQSDQLEAEIFSNLWLAALWAGRKIPGRLLRDGAQFFPDVSFLLATTPLCEGTEETCDALLDAVESGHLGSERELIALICAARRLERSHEGEQEALEFPERLLFQTRKQARKHEVLFRDEFEMMQEMLLSILAGILKDEGLERILNDHGIDRPLVDPSFEKRFFKGFQSLDSFVPSERPERVISGYQVRRPVPKLSRNAACPCGSGKKYKKCCFANDQKKLSQPSGVEGLTLDEMEKEREAHLTPESVGGLRFYEVKRLNPAKLSEAVLRPVAMRLMIFEELDHVFTLYEKTLHQDAPIWEGIFDDLLFQAIKKQRGDLVDRALELFPDLEESCRTELAIMRGHEKPTEFLEALENRCRELLESEDREREESGSEDITPGIRVQWSQLGFDLLGGAFPYLSLSIARGWLPIIGQYDVDHYLEQIEEKREELGLQPFDISEELAVFSDDLAEERFYRERARMVEAQTTRELEHQSADAKAREKELKQLRNELARIKESANRTEQEAAKRIEELEGESAKAREDGTANPEHEAEIAELRDKMRRLKSEVKRKHEQRNELRRDLRKIRAQSGKEEKPKLASTEAAVETDEEAEWLSDFEPEGEGMQPPRVPVFPDGFLKKKKDFPASVISAAMHLTGRLAAGESAAFQGVKRLKLRRGILRQKVGGSYRLLFSIDQDEVQLIDLIHRRDLEKWLSD